MNEPLNILFLGGAKRVSIAEKFIDAGKREEVKVGIYSYELDTDVPISFVGSVIIGLKWNDPKLYEDLLSVIEKNRIQVVIPFVDSATIVAAKLKTMCSSDVFIPVSDVELCEVFFNKHKANNWCKEHQIPVPDDVSTFPLIAKPVTGSASKGIIIIQNEEELHSLKAKESYLIQKFIKGKEYSIDAYVSPHNGRIMSIVPRQRLETQGGESIKSITVRHQDIIHLCRNILTKSALVGPVTLQVLEDSDTQELYFMEVNPRLGGAVLNSIEAGANSPLYMIRDYLKKENKPTEHWEADLMMIRRFTEYYKKCK